MAIFGLGGLRAKSHFWESSLRAILGQKIAQKWPFWVNFGYKNVPAHIFHRIWTKFGGIYVLSRFYSQNSLKRPFLGNFWLFWYIRAKNSQKWPKNGLFEWIFVIKTSQHIYSTEFGPNSVEYMCCDVFIAKIHSKRPFLGHFWPKNRPKGGFLAS